MVSGFALSTICGILLLAVPYFHRFAAREVSSSRFGLLESKLRHWPPGTKQTIVSCRPFFNKVMRGLLRRRFDTSESDYFTQSKRVMPQVARLLMIACALLVVTAVGLWTAREAKRERWRCLLLVSQVERAAGPEEMILVDSRPMNWCLRALASMEMRRRIVFLGSGSGQTSLPSVETPVGKEFVFVTKTNDPMLAMMRSRGWSIREAKGDRPAFGLGNGSFVVFFVVRR
jgi:hypothetical protein